MEQYDCNSHLQEKTISNKIGHPCKLAEHTNNQYQGVAISKRLGRLGTHRAKNVNVYSL